MIRLQFPEDASVNLRVVLDEKDFTELNETHIFAVEMMLKKKFPEGIFTYSFPFFCILLPSVAIEAKKKHDLLYSIVMDKLKDIISTHQLFFAGELEINEEVFRVQVVNEGDFSKVDFKDVVFYIDEKFIFPPGRKVIVALPPNDGRRPSFLYTLEVTTNNKFVIKEGGSGLRLVAATAMECYALAKKHFNEKCDFNLANYGYAFGCKPIPPCIALEVKKVKDALNCIK